MKVELPETYVAFVLSKATKAPALEDMEKLRLATVDYLLGKLQPHFPSLQRIDLSFSTQEYNANKPEPRFNLYLEIQPVVDFNGSSALPDKNAFFDRFVAAFHRDYLVEKVRQLDPSSPLASAIEVQARRLKQATPGGSVQAPKFYMGFVCAQQPTSEPSAQETELLLQKAHAACWEQLRLAYEDDFEELSLQIVGTAIGEQAGKPDATYNLYVEFQAVALFAQNAPEPIDVFQAMSSCLSTEFVLDLRTIGGFFAFIMQMAIRICIIIEIPLLVPDEGQGDPEPIIIKVHLEFFVAVVVRILVKMPTPKQLQEFDNLIQEYFSSVLATAYPKKFLDMTLKSDPEFGTGLPKARFNMLHQYKATLQMYDPPDGMKILQTIMRCQLGQLHEKINGLSCPWSCASEVTMGKAVEKPATDDAFGGKLDEEEDNETFDPPTVKPPPPQPKKEEPKKKVAVEKPFQPLLPPKLVRKLPGKEPAIMIQVDTSDVYVAFDMPLCEDEPYRRDYQALAATTRDFYAYVLKKRFPCFVDVQVSVVRVLFGKDKPDRRYNLYLEWFIQAAFQGGGGAIVPDRHRLCRSLVELNLRTYLTDHVRSLHETPFAGAVGIYSEQIQVLSLPVNQSPAYLQTDSSAIRH